ncbi:MAG: SGNH/GDSL hydrolase family protein [SAR202 cluster bacterium]|nr:SGNH/GDSL hydrolase family protein [SAR202 cluster bacterium]
MPDYWIKDGETVLFIGDSITDCGRRAADAPLGNGYVRLFTELAAARHPAVRPNYINKGISGNRITHLRDRWKDDVVYHRPDRLSIKIGINDLHSVLRNADDNVPVQRFAQLYDEVLAWTQREIGCPMVLITPFYISTDRESGSFRSMVLKELPRYIEVVEKLSRKYDARLLDLHEIFQMHLKYRDADAFCPEPVHPNHTGHLIIAQALLDLLSN